MQEVRLVQKHRWVNRMLASGLVRSIHERVDLENRENQRELQPADLRGILKYVPLWRNHVFVIGLDGGVLEDSQFENTMLGLAVLRSLGIRVVITFGIGAQLQILSEKRQISVSDTQGEGPTDSPTMELAIEAGGWVAHRIMQSLTRHGLRCCLSNGVRAVERGIIKGTDQAYTGRVDRLDLGHFESLLRDEAVPIVSPIAFTRDGSPLRINSDSLASELALALKASKLIYLMPHPGLRIRGRFHLNMDVNELRDVLDREPEAIDPEIRIKAQHAVKTIDGGTPRAHLIDCRIHDGLLMEVFSKVGIGSMIHSNPYVQIRRAEMRDTPLILNISKAAVRDESLRPRSRKDIKDQIGDYYVYDIDDSVIACFRLKLYEQEQIAEIASLSVHPAYRGRSIGQHLVQFAIRRAREAGMKRILAFTTQAGRFFREQCGFAEARFEELPESVTAEASRTGRNPLVFTRELLLGRPPDPADPRKTHY